LLTKKKKKQSWTANKYMTKLESQDRMKGNQKEEKYGSLNTDCIIFFKKTA
jgi:hypothetical protein